MISLIGLINGIIVIVFFILVAVLYFYFYYKDRKEDEDIEFNNGFITAIALFLEHKHMNLDITREKAKKLGLSDLRLYAASDHISEMHIPGYLSEILRRRIMIWRDQCFKYRLERISFERGDLFFKEAEDILAQIDEEVFHTKKIVMHYR